MPKEDISIRKNIAVVSTIHTLRYSSQFATGLIRNMLGMLLHMSILAAM